MIKFEIYSDSPIDEELVARYWAIDENGKFINYVGGLLPCRGICNTQQLVKYINEISSAWDTRQTCPKCQGFNPVRSRSDVKSKPGVINKICRNCQENEDIEIKKANDVESAELEKYIARSTECNLAKTINYESIPDDIALILIALDSAINPRLLTSCFMRDECRRLAPLDSENFIKRLWNAGVIVDLPNKVAPDAYFLKDNQLWHYNNKVAYAFVPDQTLGKGEVAFNLLVKRDYSGSGMLRQLWLDYALSECMAYLFDQCSLHQLETSFEENTEIGSILRTALQMHSVSQLWSVIWKISRDAASLSTRDYYNKQKSAATIPGKIKRHLEKILKDGVTIKCWNRPVDQPAGTLGDVLYGYFGIDEDTLGSTVMSIFADPHPEEINMKGDPSFEVIEEQVCTLMRRAIAHNLEVEVILFFANCIRNGDDVEMALNGIFSAYPALNECID